MLKPKRTNKTFLAEHKDKMVNKSGAHCVQVQLEFSEDSSWEQAREELAQKFQLFRAAKLDITFGKLIKGKPVILHIVDGSQNYDFNLVLQRKISKNL